MASPGTCRSKLAQFMTYHVLGDVHRDELVAVMHGDGVSHKIGGDMERRDQVLTTLFLPDSFISRILFSSL